MCVCVFMISLPTFQCNARITYSLTLREAHTDVYVYIFHSAAQNRTCTMYNVLHSIYLDKYSREKYPIHFWIHLKKFGAHD